MKEKEQLDKFLLTTEIVTGTITLIMFITITLLTSFLEIKESTQVMIIIFSTILLIIECLILIKIEQIAGYYKCRKCNHLYTPTYKNILSAMHIGRTRYMKCPKCNKKSWNKKVISK